MLWPSRLAHEPVGMQIANPPTNFINIQITGASYLARHAERFAENNQMLLTGSSWSQSTCKSTLFLRTDFAKKSWKYKSLVQINSSNESPTTWFPWIRPFVVWVFSLDPCRNIYQVYWPHQTFGGTCLDLTFYKLIKSKKTLPTNIYISHVS